MTREEAIRIIETVFQDEYVYKYYDSITHQALTMAIEALSAEAVQGEWIEKGGELVCSVCGNSVSFSRTPKGWVLGKFCQTCGARMKGGDDK